MEKRIEKLEKSLDEVKISAIKLDARLDSIERHMATKGDLQELSASIHKSINEQTWKFIAAVTGISGLLAAIAFGVARLFK